MHNKSSLDILEFGLLLAKLDGVAEANIESNEVCWAWLRCNLFFGALRTHKNDPVVLDRRREIKTLVLWMDTGD